MSLLFCDSFDHYTAALANTKRDTWSNADLVAGRFGNGMRFTNTNWSLGKANIGTSSPATWIVGFAFKITGGMNTNPCVRFGENATTHIRVHVNGSRQLVISRDGTTLATTTQAWSADNVWHYVELKMFLSDTVGSIYAQVDGAAETLSYVGTNGALDTRNGGSGYFNWIYFVGTSSSSFDIDDLYICDDNGSVNNDFLGDVRVEAIFPSGNGNSSVLVGSDGNSTDNYALVDEATPSTGDYVGSPALRREGHLRLRQRHPNHRDCLRCADRPLRCEVRCREPILEVRGTPLSDRGGQCRKRPVDDSPVQASGLRDKARRRSLVHLRRQQRRVRREGGLTWRCSSATPLTTTRP